MDWLPAGSVFMTSFFASSVEAVEALTIVLAAGIVRGWRSTLAGAAAALGLLAGVVLVFGTTIASVPVHYLQVVVGTLLVLFGIRWLRKAMLRSIGAIALRDEAASFREGRDALVPGAGSRDTWDTIAFLTSFKAVALEGLEVVIIVIGLGAAGDHMVPASVGAVVACVVVAVTGAVLRHPLARVPENTLKFVVGIMVASFGLFWFGEGIGVRWPGGDPAIVAIMAIFLTTSLAGVALARKQWDIR